MPIYSPIASSVPVLVESLFLQMSARAFVYETQSIDWHCVAANALVFVVVGRNIWATDIVAPRGRCGSECPKREPRVMELTGTDPCRHCPPLFWLAWRWKCWNHERADAKMTKHTVWWTGSNETRTNPLPPAITRHVQGKHQGRSSRYT